MSLFGTILADMPDISFLADPQQDSLNNDQRPINSHNLDNDHKTEFSPPKSNHNNSLSSVVSFPAVFRSEKDVNVNDPINRVIIVRNPSLDKDYDPEVKRDDYALRDVPIHNKSKLKVTNFYNTVSDISPLMPSKKLCTRGCKQIQQISVIKPLMDIGHENETAILNSDLIIDESDLIDIKIEALNEEHLPAFNSNSYYPTFFLHPHFLPVANEIIKKVKRDFLPQYLASFMLYAKKPIQELKHLELWSCLTKEEKDSIYELVVKSNMFGEDLLSQLKNLCNSCYSTLPDKNKTTPLQHLAQFIHMKTGFKLRDYPEAFVVLKKLFNASEVFNLFLSFFKSKLFRNKNGGRIKSFIRDWAVDWPNEQKQLFIKKASSFGKVDFIGVATGFMSYFEFDYAMMFASSQEHILPFFTNMNNHKIIEIIETLALCVEDEEKRLHLLKTSPFYTNAWETQSFWKDGITRIDTFVEAICAYKNLPLPTNLISRRLDKTIAFLLTQLTNFKMSQNSVIKALQQIKDHSPDLCKNIISIVESLKVSKFLELIPWIKDSSQECKYGYPNIPTCWIEGKDDQHSKYYNYIKVNSENILDIKNQILQCKKSCIVVHRICQDFTHANKPAVFMWVIPGDDHFDYHWLDCLSLENEVLHHINESLFAANTSIIVQNDKELRRAVHLLTSEYGKSKCKFQKCIPEIKTCAATFADVILDSEDISECLLHHMAMQIDSILEKNSKVSELTPV